MAPQTETMKKMSSNVVENLGRGQGQSQMRLRCGETDTGRYRQWTKNSFPQHLWWGLSYFPNNSTLPSKYI